MKIFAFALREYDELVYMRREALRQEFDFDYTTEHLTLDNVDLATGADAVSVLLSKMDKPVLDRLSELGIRSVALRSIGFDNIDLDYAKSLGMRVAHAAYPPDGVANFAIMLMMECLRRVKYINRQALANNFDLEGKLGRDISSCTVGIVGTGRIGATVAKHLSGFGCKMLAYDPYPNESLKGLVDYVDIDELVQRSDAITLHVPANAETRHLIDRRRINMMKKEAVLINTARGDLIETEALIDAMEEGRIFGCGIDALEGEGKLLYNDLTVRPPMDRNRSILQTMDYAIIYPHMAFYTEEDVEHMIKSSCSALVAFTEGNDSPFEV